MMMKKRITSYAGWNISTHKIIRELENAYSEFTGRSYALAHNNGTSALLAAFHSIGLQPGDEVLVPSATCDVQRIQGFLLTILNVAMNNFLSFVSAIIYIGWIQWKLLVVGFAIVPVVALATRGFRHVLFNSDSAAREAVSNANNQAVSGIENLSYLKKGCIR